MSDIKAELDWLAEDYKLLSMGIGDYLSGDRPKIEADRQRAMRIIETCRQLAAIHQMAPDSMAVEVAGVVFADPATGAAVAADVALTVDVRALAAMMAGRAYRAPTTPVGATAWCADWLGIVRARLVRFVEVRR